MKKVKILVWLGANDAVYTVSSDTLSANKYKTWKDNFITSGSFIQEIEIDSTKAPPVDDLLELADRLFNKKLVENDYAKAAFAIGLLARKGEVNKTLYHQLMDWRLSQETKHELPTGWAEEDINNLTNEELLKEISDALELRENSKGL